MRTYLIGLSLQSPASQFINQSFVIVRLFVLTFFHQAQIIRDIPPIKLPSREPISQERKSIHRVPIPDIKILIPRRLHEIKEMQPRPRIYGCLTIRPPLLEPRPTRTGPRGPLQEQIRVLAKLPADVQAGRDRLDPFDL